jgi:DNA-binding Lrp family transcriptional regulator
MTAASNDLRRDRGGSPLDDVDRVLVETLAADARLANNRLADRAGVAPSTALARIRALLARGVLRGFHADIDPAAVGRSVQALIAVRLRSHDRRQIEAFATTVPRLPEVLQSFHVAGADDYLLHVAVPSAECLRDWILDHLTTHPAVAHSQTSLVFAHVRGHVGPLPPRRRRSR